MGIFDYEKEHIFENDVLYRGYANKSESMVCFNYYFGNSLSETDIDFWKTFDGKNYTGKTGFWIGGTPEEIFCNILNKTYQIHSAKTKKTSSFDRKVTEIWFAMWNDYYSTIDLNAYCKIVDSLLASNEKKLTSNERLFAYLSVCGNYELFNFKLEKIFWMSNSNIYFKRLIENHDLNDYDFTKICQEYMKADNIKSEFNIVFRLNTFKDFFAYILSEFIERNIIIKKCANCGKYFAPKNRSDTLYCDNYSPQDNSKTCKEYGAIKTYQNNLKNNEAMGLYRKIYMQKQMRAKRYPDIEIYKNDFDIFREQTKQWKEDIKRGAKLPNEYLEWLKQIKKEKGAE